MRLLAVFEPITLVLFGAALSAYLVGLLSFPVAVLLFYAALILSDLDYAKRSLQTLPRDLVIMKAFLRLQYELLQHKRNNITVGDEFAQVAARHPAKTAMIDVQKKVEWSFEDADQLMNKIANYFQSHEFKKGEVISVYVPNCPEYVCIWTGLSRIGCEGDGVFMLFACESRSDPVTGRPIPVLVVDVLQNKMTRSKIADIYYAAQRSLQLSRLRVQLENDQEVALTDMCLTFHINPSSADYGYDGVDLITGGSDAHVSLDNLERYIDLCHEYYIRAGLRRQLDAFRRGFDRVFPMQSLAQFTADEIRLILCGDQYPSWTYEDVLNYTEPRLGYTRDSETFILFAQVMAELTGEERKRFLQFTTGCSSLPPGGLASLQPRLTVVRKVDGTDGSYPSVNTCVHYLKLPEYSTAVILKERLLAATAEKGFHLN